MPRGLTFFVVIGVLCGCAHKDDEVSRLRAELAQERAKRSVVTNPAVHASNTQPQNPYYAPPTWQQQQSYVPPSAPSNQGQYSGVDEGIQAANQQVLDFDRQVGDFNAQLRRLTQSCQKYEQENKVALSNAQQAPTGTPEDS